METSWKITKKNERDLMQKENQQSGVDSVSDCDIVLSCGTESPPAEPDLSYIPKRCATFSVISDDA